MRTKMLCFSKSYSTFGAYLGVLEYLLRALVDGCIAGVLYAVMEKVLEVDVTVITFIVGSVIPLIVGFLTKLKASSSVKAMANIVLSIIAGAGSVLIAAEGSITWKNLVTSVFTTLISSGLTYNNIWKPTGVAAKVSNIAPGTGLGAEVEKSPGSGLLGTEGPEVITQPSVPAATATPTTPVPMSPRVKEVLDESDHSLLLEENGMLVYLVPVKVATEVAE